MLKTISTFFGQLLSPTPDHEHAWRYRRALPPWHTSAPVPVPVVCDVCGKHGTAKHGSTQAGG
jgi:hypothetical protein